VQDPYALVTDLKKYRDWRQVADWVSTDDSRGGEVEFDANTVVLEHLRAASGRVQSACLVRSLYTHAQLAALADNAKSHLTELTVRLALYTLSRFRRRAVDSDIEEGYRLALQDLERLASGVRIFGGLPAVVEAGLPTTVDAMDSIPDRLIDRASRFFGYRGRDSRSGNGD
jgi:hypothetical protein